MKKEDKKKRLQKRVRSKIKKSQIRLSVFRSNKHIYAQIIDDTLGKTLLSVSEKEVKEDTGTKVDKAKTLGLLLAKKSKVKKITKVVFDRGRFRYHGRVKALADGAREGGLEF